MWPREGDYGLLYLREQPPTPYSAEAVCRVLLSFLLSALPVVMTFLVIEKRLTSCVPLGGARFFAPGSSRALVRAVWASMTHVAFAALCVVGTLGDPACFADVKEFLKFGRFFDLRMQILWFLLLMLQPNFVSRNAKVMLREVSVARSWSTVGFC